MKDFITQQVKEVGLGIAAFCLMSWMVVTITTGMVKSIDNLSTHMREFTIKVGIEHQNAIEQHKEMIMQQREITSVLGGINGYKD